MHAFLLFSSQGAFSLMYRYISSFNVNLITENSKMVRKRQKNGGRETLKSQNPLKRPLEVSPKVSRLSEDLLYIKISNEKFSTL